MSLSPLPAALASLLIASCALMPVTAATKLGDAANDLNTAARFGRMDVALDLVSAKVRDDFAKSHAGWGKKVRIADIEFDAIKIDHKKDDAVVTVSVTWLRHDDPTTHNTTVSQKWIDVRGNWILTSEEVVGGDVGLLGEAGTPADADAPAAAPRSRYQTHVIYGGDE